MERIGLIYEYLPEYYVQYGYERLLGMTEQPLPFAFIAAYVYVSLCLCAGDVRRGPILSLLFHVDSHSVLFPSAPAIRVPDCW